MKKARLTYIVWQLLLSIAFLSVAVLIRFLFFSGLGRGIPYLTFYPTVALVALFGSLLSGAIVTIGSFLLTYYWIQQGALSHAELLAEAVFIFSCLLISFVGQLKNRADVNEKEISKDLEIKKNELAAKNEEINQRNERLKKEMEARVEIDKELKSLAKDLNIKLKELQDLNKLMVGRELKMIELKKENEHLKDKLNAISK